MITPHEHSVSGALEEMTNQLLGVVDPQDKRSELLVELVTCLSNAATLHFELQKLEGPDRQRLASSSLEAVRESLSRSWRVHVNPAGLSVALLQIVRYLCKE